MAPTAASVERVSETALRNSHRPKQEPTPRGILQAVGAPRYERHAIAARGEAARDFAADAGRGAGHQRGGVSIGSGKRHSAYSAGSNKTMGICRSLARC